MQGSVQHSGSGLSLTKGSVKMVVQDLAVNPAIKGSVTGDIFVNNKSVASDVLLFNLDGSTIKPLTQDATGAAVISGYKARLAAPFAKVLDSRFKTEAFKAKDSVGGLTIALKLPKGKK